MAYLSQFIGGGKLRYQEFLASGTFTPSAALLANGGQVYVEMAGGGGSGGTSYLGSFGGGGGSSYWCGCVTVSGAVSVVVGAGGAKPVTSPTSGSQGGTTSFGYQSVVGGLGGIQGEGEGGAGSGMGFAGERGGPRPAVGGGFGGGGGGRVDGAPNTGGGGAGGQTSGSSGNGGSGFVRVYWYE